MRKIKKDANIVFIYNIFKIYLKIVRNIVIKKKLLLQHKIDSLEIANKTDSIIRVKLILIGNKGVYLLITK